MATITSPSVQSQHITFLNKLLPTQLLKSLGSAENILATIPQNPLLQGNHPQNSDILSWVEQREISYEIIDPDHLTEISISSHFVIFLVKRDYGGYTDFLKPGLPVDRALHLFLFSDIFPANQPEFHHQASMCVGPFLPADFIDKNGSIVYETYDRESRDQMAPNETIIHPDLDVPQLNPSNPREGIVSALVKNHCYLANVLKSPNRSIGWITLYENIEYLLPENIAKALGGPEEIFQKSPINTTFIPWIKQTFQEDAIILDSRFFNRNQVLRYEIVDEKYDTEIAYSDECILYFVKRSFIYEGKKYENTVNLFLFADPIYRKREIAFFGPFFPKDQKHIDSIYCPVTNFNKLVEIFKSPQAEIRISDLELPNTVS